MWLASPKKKNKKKKVQMISEDAAEPPSGLCERLDCNRCMLFDYGGQNIDVPFSLQHFTLIHKAWFTPADWQVKSRGFAVAVNNTFLGLPVNLISARCWTVLPGPPEHQRRHVCLCSCVWWFCHGVLALEYQLMFWYPFRHQLQIICANELGFPSA